MTIAANIGDLAILEFSACFPDSIVGFVPRNNNNLNYLYYNFSAMKLEMLGTATLNTQMNLNIERIGSLFSIRPPSQEQEQIANYLDYKINQIEALITKTRTSIDHLKEYRTALISAAVTGKIDVREEVA
jgi:type I restriction enzyme, S subunit